MNLAEFPLMASQSMESKCLVSHPGLLIESTVPGCKPGLLKAHHLVAFSQGGRDHKGRVLGSTPLLRVWPEKQTVLLRGPKLLGDRIGNRSPIRQ